MRLYVIAGSRAEYHEFLLLTRTAPAAAVFCATEGVLRRALGERGMVAFHGRWQRNPVARRAWALVGVGLLELLDPGLAA